MGFLWDFQPHFHYCLLLLVKSYVWSLVEFQRCEFLKLQDEHMKVHENKQKPYC